jgi:hypothetical protein
MIVPMFVISRLGKANQTQVGIIEQNASQSMHIATLHI